MRFLFIAFWCIASAALAEPKVVLRLYFVRHGETVANATGTYNGRTVDRFSGKGEGQVGELTKELAGYRFDAICVSPMERALRTVAPFLRKSGATAEVWPELAECCHQKARDVTPSAALPRGAVFAPPADLIRLLRVNPADNRTFDPANYADGLALIRRAAARVHERFDRSGKSVLLVGHSLAGTRLIEVLLGWEPTGRFNIANAEISELEQLDDGSFRLVALNGKVSKFTMPPGGVRRRSGD